MRMISRASEAQQASGMSDTRITTYNMRVIEEDETMAVHVARKVFQWIALTGQKRGVF